MCTLLSMVYWLFTLCWLIHVLCTSFKETALLFNVHLNFFVDFILSLTEKYISKVENKRNRLICWMCSKWKINTAWNLADVFVDFEPQSAHQDSVSIFNFEQVFVSRVWKTSNNVLKTQKAIYLFHKNCCKAYFIQSLIIAPNWNELWTYDSVSALNLL